MKVYSVEESLNLIDYYSRSNWRQRLDTLLNTQIEDKEYDNDTVNEFFSATVGCIVKCFDHYNMSATGLKLFFVSEMILILNKIKEKVKPLFIIDVIPYLYEGNTIFIQVTINNTIKYYEFKMKIGFKSIKEEDYIHYLDIAEIDNDKKLNHIQLKEMEF